jgi:hypothetical protein
MDYFIQNGGKKKRTKNGSNSLKSKKSGGNFLGNFSGSMENKKIKNTMKKGGACTLMPDDEKRRRGVAAALSGNYELAASIFVEEKFREICFEKQQSYRLFDSEIDKLKKAHWQQTRENYPKEQIEELKRTWANTANRDMKSKLNDLINKQPDRDRRTFFGKFKKNILDNDEVLLCFTEKVTELLNPNQPYNQRQTTNMYVRFNNIFENKSKLNSLLKQNNSSQKSESSSDMFSRLLAQASNQGHAAQANNQYNTNTNN